MTISGSRRDADVVIVGGGFAGALTAMALRRRGRSVLLVERGRHPRFAIGESSTPLANLLIEELADTYDLPRLRPLSKWGTWRRTYPDIGCGLKRGFSFFHHEFDRPFQDTDAHDRQLLVAASPHDDIADTHWYRPDVDHFLVREAERHGAVYLDEVTLEQMTVEGDGVRLDGRKDNYPLQLSARFLIDASGPRGFLHRVLHLGDAPTRWLPATAGLYTHFTGVARWDQQKPAAGTPYPVDAAALHHVFPGGWIWVLRFANGITSAGAAVTDALARELRLHEGASAWDRLLARLPAVRVQFASARAALPFVYAPRLAFRTEAVCGTHWALLPSAVGVIDPLLSTGFPLTLLGISRLVDVVTTTWEQPAQEEALARYAADTQAELDATERLVAALYATMTDFPLFKRLSLLYFAAASFSETVRRLGRPDRVPGFLLHNDPIFGPALRDCTDAALARPTGAARDALMARIDRAIDPINVAGLLDRTRRDWFPVRVDDLLAAAPRLGATSEELHQLVERCGLQDVARAAGCM
jgi:tetracycline 7-halogenase / FADH2 O2-dependent halogenase